MEHKVPISRLEFKSFPNDMDTAVSRICSSVRGYNISVPDWVPRDSKTQKKDPECGMVTNIFPVIVIEILDSLQMEIADLQHDSDLKIKFTEVYFLEFYQKWKKDCTW